MEPYMNVYEVSLTSLAVMERKSHCQQCSKPVQDRHQAVSCDSCGEWQHRGCDTGITKYNYQNMKRGDLELPFTCTVCKRNESSMETIEIGGISELHLAIPVMEAMRLSIAEEIIHEGMTIQAEEVLSTNDP